MKHQRLIGLVIFLVIAIVTTQGVIMLFASPDDKVNPGRYYRVIENLGRDVPVERYDSLFNAMATEGWEFDQWLYRGSAQTPDMIFKKK